MTTQWLTPACGEHKHWEMQGDKGAGWERGGGLKLVLSAILGSGYKYVDFSRWHTTFICKGVWVQEVQVFEGRVAFLVFSFFFFLFPLIHKHRHALMMQALCCWLKVLPALTAEVQWFLPSIRSHWETCLCTNQRRDFKLYKQVPDIPRQYSAKSATRQEKHARAHWIIELLSAEDMLVFAGSAGFLCRKWLSDMRLGLIAGALR